MEPVYCPETSATHYQSTPRNFPKEGRLQLHCGRPETSLYSVLMSAWCIALRFIAIANQVTQLLVVSRQLCNWGFHRSVCLRNDDHGDDDDYDDDDDDNNNNNNNSGYTKHLQHAVFEALR